MTIRPNSKTEFIPAENPDAPWIKDRDYYLSEEDIDILTGRVSVPKDSPGWRAFKSSLEEQVGGDHYKKMAIQPIEYITKNELDWCEGNIVKYITRHHFKGGIEDIDKVIHYCEMLKELKYGKE